MVILSRSGFLTIFDLDLMLVEFSMPERFFSGAEGPKLGVNCDGSLMVTVDFQNRNQVNFITYNSAVSKVETAESQDVQDGEFNFFPKCKTDDFSRADSGIGKEDFSLRDISSPTDFNVR